MIRSVNVTRMGTDVTYPIKKAPPSRPPSVSVRLHSLNSMGNTGVMVINAMVFRTRQVQLKKTRRRKDIDYPIGIRKCTLIITLPGSPKAIDQCLEVVKPVLPHVVELLNTDQMYNHPN